MTRLYSANGAQHHIGAVQPDVEYLETPSGDGMIYMAKRRMSEQLVYFRCQHLMMPNYWEGGSTYEEAK